MLTYFLTKSLVFSHKRENCNPRLFRHLDSIVGKNEKMRKELKLVAIRVQESSAFNERAPRKLAITKLPIRVVRAPLMATSESPFVVTLLCMHALDLIGPN